MTLRKEEQTGKKERKWRRNATNRQCDEI